MSRTLTQQEKAALERIAYVDEGIDTRLNPDTLKSKVELFRPRMVETALDHQTMTYSELTNDFHDLAWQDIGQVLGLIGLLEDEFKRPLLPAVVVNEKQGTDDTMPGKNYFGLVQKSSQYGEVPPESNTEARRRMWEKHREEVWKFDWKS